MNPEARLPALGRVILRGEEERRAAGCERGKVVRAGRVAGEGAAEVDKGRVEDFSLSKVMEDRTEEMPSLDASPSSTSFSTRLLGRSKDGPGGERDSVMPVTNRNWSCLSSFVCVNEDKDNTSTIFWLMRINRLIEFLVVCVCVLSTCIYPLFSFYLIFFSHDYKFST